MHAIIHQVAEDTMYIRQLMVVAFSARVRILGGRFDESIHACGFLNWKSAHMHQLHSFRCRVVQ